MNSTSGRISNSKIIGIISSPGVGQPDNQSDDPSFSGPFHEEENRMAVKISSEIQEFMKGKLGWVATSSKDNIPNVAIKGTLQVIDDEHLIFADLFSGKTRKNLEENSNVAIMVMDVESRKGYSLKGVAELIPSGPLYDQIYEGVKKMLGPQIPAPKYVVKVEVQSIFDQSLGPTAGKQIA
jgi:uncharacterized protein